MYVQKELDEMQQMMDQEKDQLRRMQEKAVNRIRATCAKVILLLFLTFADLSFYSNSLMRPVNHENGPVINPSIKYLTCCHKLAESQFNVDNATFAAQK